jgi:hypothetical protein
MNPIHETVTLERDESILALYRRHGSTVVLSILPYALLCILLFLFIFPLFSLGIRGVIAFAGCAILFSILAFRKIIAWLGTITILTNRRLLVIQRFGFFKKKVNEIKLDQVSELSYEVKGMTQTLGRYGTIYLLVTFTSATIHIPDIPDPQAALNTISQAIGRVQKNPNPASAAPGMNEKQPFPLRGKKPIVIHHAPDRADPANWK